MQTIALKGVLQSKLDRYRASDPRAVPLPADLQDADMGMVQGLLSSLGGSNPRYADLAQQDLKALGLPGLRPLIRCLKNARTSLGDTTRQRWFIARTLGSIEHPMAALTLLELAKKDPNAQVRSMAIFQLGETPLNPDWVLPHLCLRLKYEKDSECHRLMGQVLAGHQNYSFLRAWFELSRSPDPSESAPIFEALQALEEETGQTAADLAKAWGQPGSQTPPPSDALLHEVWQFVSELSGEHFQLRGVDDARFALSDLGPWLATELAPALADTDVYVRLHVGQVLERLGPRAVSAVPALIAALKDPDLGPQASTSLAAIDDLRALEPLLLAASDKSPLDLRSSAVRALGKTTWPESADTLRTVLSDSQDPGQEGLEPLAHAALLQVDPSAETFDALLRLLTEPLAANGTAELAFSDALLRQTRGEDPGDQALADWNCWKEMGAAFGSRPSAKGLGLRRESRSTWLQENRERLLSSLGAL
ncbi:MAG: HEAT repeat domain-containing protein [bacterium]|nr:HEAT repeat domain-containing protein [bacterium]